MDRPVIRTATIDGGRALLAVLVLMLCCSSGLAAEPRVLVLNEAAIQSREYLFIAVDDHWFAI